MLLANNKILLTIRKPRSYQYLHSWDKPENVRNTRYLMGWPIQSISTPKSDLFQILRLIIRVRWLNRLVYFMGLEFDPDAIADLQREFGGHPFFTRQVCSKIHQIASVARPIKVSNAALQRAKSEFSGQRESYLRDIIEQLRMAYPEEYEILTAILAGEKTEVDEFGREVPDLIDHLVGCELITRVGDYCDITFEAIKLALNHLVLSNTSDDD